MIGMQKIQQKNESSLKKKSYPLKTSKAFEHLSVEHL